MKLNILNFLAFLALGVGACSSGAKSPAAPAAVIEGGSWSHAPFEIGACSTCHATDNAADPGPVESTGRALCEGCHEQAVAEALALAHRHPKFEQCLSCHAPHNGADRRLLRAEEPALCQECHAQLPTTHPQVEGTTSCLSCHEAHASANAPLRRADTTEKQR